MVGEKVSELVLTVENGAFFIELNFSNAKVPNGVQMKEPSL